MPKSQVTKNRRAALRRAKTAPMGITNPFLEFQKLNQSSGRKRKRSRRPNARMQNVRSGLDIASAGLMSQSAAVSYAKGQRSGEPKFLGRSAQSTRIVHRELITSISGSATFTVANSFALNPGIAATFPWLSVEAQGWEQYRFHRVRFCYYARCSTATPGSMMLVPDYDAADAAPSTEQIASSYRDVVEEVPWVVEFCCNLDPRAMLEPASRKFVRTGPLAANLDIKTYDGGNLFVCTTDGSATNWGKLWVEYDVEFFVPQLPPTGSQQQASQHLISTAPTTASFLAAFTTQAGSSSVVSISSNVLTFLVPGRFLVSYQFVGTSDTQTAQPAFGAGCTLIPTFSPYSTGGAGFALAGNTTAAYSQVLFVSTAVGGTITYGNTVVGGTQGDLFVVAVPTGQA